MTNVLRIDPTRTATLRRSISTEINRWYAAVRRDLLQLIVEEDAFGLAQSKPMSVWNAFCPTGKGGGIDNSCSPTHAQSYADNYAKTKGVKTPVVVSMIKAETGQRGGHGVTKYDPETKEHRMSGEIVVRDDGTLTKEQIQKIIEHEIVHVKQSEDGRWVMKKNAYKNNAHFWNGVEIIEDKELGKLIGRINRKGSSLKSRQKAFEEYKNLPWEAEAYSQVDLDLSIDPTTNAFCPTGEGGGIDPTCSPKGSFNKDLYHSTGFSKEIEKTGEFKPSDGVFGRGVYFSLKEDRDAAGNQGGDKKTFKVKTSVTNPLVLDLTKGKTEKEWEEQEDYRIWKSLGQGKGEEGRQRLLDAGYDGVAVKFGTTQYNLVLDPKKIRVLSLNAFCPTGEGGGIDNSCSPSVSSYLMSGYTRTNKELRQGRVPKEAREIDEQMKVIGRKVLYRGIRVKEGKDYRVGQTITDLGYVSTTNDPEVARDKGGYVTSGVVFKISTPDSQRGIEIGGPESEIILPRGTKFQIEKIEQNEYGAHLLSVKVLDDPTTNAEPGRFRFASRSDKIEQFGKWIEETFAKHVSSSANEARLAQYVATVHKKGMARSYDDKNRMKSLLGSKTDALRFVGGREEFLRRQGVDPTLVDKVKVLVKRTYTDIKDVDVKAAGTMRRILVDGIAAGESPRVVAKKMTDALDMTRVQALMVARTETIRAHAEGQLDAMERMGVRNVKADVEFSATKLLDGTFESEVCPKCQELDGTTYKIEKARGIIPVHPNCRCAWKFVDEDIQGEKQDSYLRKLRAREKARKEKLKPTPKVKTKTKPKKIKKTDDGKGKVDKLKSFSIVMFGKTIKSKAVQSKTKATVRKAKTGTAGKVKKTIPSKAIGGLKKGRK